MDAKIQEMIKKRQEANLEILNEIGVAIMNFPDLRFGQILANLDIIEYDYDKINGVAIPKDPFHEESVITLKRIKNRREK